jgi:hypothetical protein
MWIITVGHFASGLPVLPVGGCKGNKLMITCKNLSIMATVRYSVSCKRWNLWCTWHSQSINIDLILPVISCPSKKFVLTGYLSWNKNCKYYTIITLLPFFIEMLQYDWLWSGDMIIKEMFHIPIKLKAELARASMTTSDVNNQWRSNFQQQII